MLAKASQLFSDTRAIHWMNIGLIGASCALAFVIPFELLLLAYVFLGPAHYLTEIGWLHRHAYYTLRKYDYLFLWSLSILWLIGLLSGVTISVLWPALIIALAVTFTREWGTRVLLLGLLFMAYYFFQEAQTILFLGVLIPTLIHVFVFTGMFMLWGALKERSMLGVLSVTALALAGASFFLFPELVQTYSVADEVSAQLSIFAGAREALQSLTGLSNSPAAFAVVSAFMSFAYLYHYLNWFTKTKVIGWVNMTKVQGVLFLFVYLVAVTLYIRDYTYGLYFMLLLSFAHVVLEFPLNARSFVGIGKETLAILKGVTNNPRK